ncbi:MAG: hypothetical protein N3G22_04515 [Candidatus Micrarchaeota archaeon]|nr:hypothetical protein [Candidatus Micrarchaeota archaeon]
MALDIEISAIGRQMVCCPHKCQGVKYDKASGFVPRGMVLETSSGDWGVVIVGQNPGQAKDYERLEYINTPSEQLYDKEKELFETYFSPTKSRSHPYHKRLYGVAEVIGRELGKTGQPNILWTELVKCQSDKINDENVPLELDTIRMCFNCYLRRELEKVPKDWPIIAAESRTFNAIALLFLDRAVLGIPHPTGSKGNFSRLWSKLERGTCEKFSEFIRRIKQNEKPAMWLSD